MSTKTIDLHPTPSTAPERERAVPAATTTEIGKRAVANREIDLDGLHERMEAMRQLVTDTYSMVISFQRANPGEKPQMHADYYAFREKLYPLYEEYQRSAVPEGPFIDALSGGSDTLKGFVTNVLLNELAIQSFKEGLDRKSIPYSPPSLDQARRGADLVIDGIPASLTTTPIVSSVAWRLATKRSGLAGPILPTQIFDKKRKAVAKKRIPDDQLAKIVTSIKNTRVKSTPTKPVHAQAKKSPEKPVTTKRTKAERKRITQAQQAAARARKLAKASKRAKPITTAGHSLKFEDRSIIASLPNHSVGLESNNEPPYIYPEDRTSTKAERIFLDIINAAVGERMIDGYKLNAATAGSLILNTIDHEFDTPSIMTLKRLAASLVSGSRSLPPKELLEGLGSSLRASELRDFMTHAYDWSHPSVQPERVASFIDDNMRNISGFRVENAVMRLAKGSGYEVINATDDEDRLGIDLFINGVPFDIKSKEVSAKLHLKRFTEKRERYHPIKFVPPITAEDFDGELVVPERNIERILARTNFIQMIDDAIQQYTGWEPLIDPEAVARDEAIERDVERDLALATERSKRSAPKSPI